MKSAELVNVTVVTRETGKLNWFALDSKGRLWKGYEIQSGAEIIWEELNRPQVDDSSKNQSRVSIG